MRFVASRRPFVLLALPGAAAALAAAPSSAGASCVLGPTRAVYATTDVAFVGRMVSSSPEDGRATFVVDEPLKGVVTPGSHVVVGSELGPGFIYALTSTSGQREAAGTVGLVARQGPSGELLSSTCGLYLPEALRAAAASGRSTCLAPTALPLTVRTRRGSRVARLSARVSGGEAGGVLRIAWGDGRTTSAPIDPSGPGRATVRAAHGYPRTGTFRISATVETPVPIDCAGTPRPGGGAPSFPPKTSQTRLRTVRLRAAR